MTDMKPINRVLLLAKISEDTEKNISTILSDGEGIYGVDEAKIREIDKMLGAKNFNEFLEKFAPRITTVVNSIGEASWKSIDVNQKIGNLLNLDYPLLKMLCAIFCLRVIMSLALAFFSGFLSSSSKYFLVLYENSPLICLASSIICFGLSILKILW